MRASDDAGPCPGTALAAFPGRPPRASRLRGLRTHRGDDMSQGDLAAAATGTRKGEAAKVVAVLFALVRDGLRRGEKVAISGFGSFETARREAREGRNPRTGAKVQVAASTTVKFKPGKGLQDAWTGGAWGCPGPPLGALRRPAARERHRRPAPR